MLSGEVARRFGRDGLPADRIRLNLTGTAGQSLGCWNAPGVSIHLEGDANDYVGKGMSGGRIVLTTAEVHRERAQRNVICGNACLYGATGGELFANGQAGERFAVRNSGAQAVIEGAGHHACEYMTGGTVVIMGPVGPNLAAGMTGGELFLLDPNNQVGRYLNPEFVEASAAGRPALRCPAPPPEVTGHGSRQPDRQRVGPQGARFVGHDAAALGLRRAQEPGRQQRDLAAGRAAAPGQGIGAA